MSVATLQSAQAATRAERIRGLAEQTQALARAEVADWIASVADLRDRSDTISRDEAYPVGVRNLARTLARELETTGLAARSIASRQP